MAFSALSNLPAVAAGSPDWALAAVRASIEERASVEEQALVVEQVLVAEPVFVEEQALVAEPVFVEEQALVVEQVFVEEQASVVEPASRALAASLVVSYRAPAYLAWQSVGTGSPAWVAALAAAWVAARAADQFRADSSEVDIQACCLVPRADD